MTRDDALAVLKATKPLLARLIADGIYIELNEDENTVLGDFEVLWLNVWRMVGDPEILKITGLSMVDLGLLNTKIRFERHREKKQQNFTTGYLEEETQVNGFEYQSVLLHKLPGGRGWEVLGIKADMSRQIIIKLPATLGKDVAILWANQSAQKLAGRPAAEIN